MRSIRTYLLSRLLGGAALVLAVAGIGVYLVVARSLEAQFDANLADRVQAFASILFQVEDELSFEFSEQLMPEYDREELPDYFELWFEDGRLIERSPSLGEQDLDVEGTPSFDATHWTAPLPDGRQGRFVARLIEVHHVYPEEGPGRPQAATIRVVLAGGREELAAAERIVMAECLLVSLLLMLVIGAISWRAVTRGLEPADRLAATLDAIRVDDLPRQLDVGQLPDELVPVGAKIDALIRRVDAALERERRTTADIAHELRTPISELITVSEVALRDRGGNGTARRALSTMRDVAWRMGRSVSTLLELAMLEMGTETFVREPVDLEQVLREELESLSALRRERGLRLDEFVDPDTWVDGNRDVLRIVVANLLGNALYYCPRGGRVECRLERLGDGWRFLIQNDAPDLRPEDLEVLSEPFWRKDHARSDRSRAGLGLALSRALAGKTGLELGFELEDGAFRAVLTGREEAA